MGSKVYENLYHELDKQGIEQSIFYPVRKAKLEKLENYKRDSKFKVICSRVLRPYHSILFRCKIRYLYKDLKPNVALGQFDIVHATTLFSDGALALRLYEQYSLPYIVAVRGSDVNVFFNYRKDLFFLARNILRKASKIIFISSSLEHNFFKNSFMARLRTEISHKCVVINNGVEPTWLLDLKPKKNTVPTKLLYIGNFDINKNIPRLIDAFIVARDKNQNLTLDIVGGGGKSHNEVVTAIEENKASITYHGRVYDKKKLKQIYANAHILAMTSISETFGLVYVEALTQGLPIICSENQGIDGTFEEKVGEFVDPKSVSSIAHAIEHTIRNYQSYDLANLDFAKFDWKSITQQYLDIYSNAISDYKIN